MITSKTVFIVGAGASSEVDLPVGNILKQQISQKLEMRFEDLSRQVSGDPLIFHFLLQRYGRDINQILDTCRSISEGLVLANSIDDYIDVHQDDPVISICGKLAISKCILEAERASRLFISADHNQGTIDFSGLNETWYVQFYVLLTQQVRRSELEHIFDNVTIVTFNYDRCIEHFLVHAIEKFYRISLQEARDLVSRLKIFHVYGMVGKYFGSSNETLEFGARGLLDIDTVTRNIRTYCERADDDQTMTEMHAAFMVAKRLVFLGTAFHKLNMDLITPQASGEAKGVYATRKGFSRDEDLLVVCQKYLSKISGVPMLGGLNSSTSNYRFSDECNKLFSDYHASLRA